MIIIVGTGSHRELQVRSPPALANGSYRDLIGRLLLRYWWIGASNVPKVKAAVVVAYFNKIQRLKAKRASKKAAPLSFEEHEKYIKEALAP